MFYYFKPGFSFHTAIHSKYQRRKTPLVNIHNSSIVMMFFLISVDCITLLKRLSQLAFSDRIKHPDISKNALWLLTPKPLPQISKQASPHNLIKDCSTSASLQMSDKNVDVVSLTSLCLMMIKPLSCRIKDSAH